MKVKTKNKVLTKNVHLLFLIFFSSSCMSTSYSDYKKFERMTKNYRDGELFLARLVKEPQKIDSNELDEGNGREIQAFRESEGIKLIKLNIEVISLYVNKDNDSHFITSDSNLFLQKRRFCDSNIYNYQYCYIPMKNSLDFKYFKNIFKSGDSIVIYEPYNNPLLIKKQKMYADYVYKYYAYMLDRFYILQPINVNAKLPRIR